MKLLRAALLALFALVPAAVAAAELPAAGSVEVLFSPWDDAEGGILKVVGEAQHSIHVQAYLLTSRTIAKALLTAAQRGVQVALMADAEMVRNGENSQVPKIAEAGIPVWLETRYGNAHNKVILVDAAGKQPVVVTGSYNFTWSAQARNAENLIILRDNPAVAMRYLRNWERHKRDAQPYASFNFSAEEK